MGTGADTPAAPGARSHAEPDEPDELVDRLARAWRELRRGAATEAAVQIVFGRPGDTDALEPTHLDVLDLLVARDGQRMSELALALRVDPSTITRTMHRMETAGLVARQPLAADGRVVTAHLTPAGRRIQAAASGRRAALLAAVLGDLSAAERAQFVELLERFLRGVAAHVADPGSVTTAAG